MGGGSEHPGRECVRKPSCPCRRAWGRAETAGHQLTTRARCAGDSILGTPQPSSLFAGDPTHSGLNRNVFSQFWRLDVAEIRVLAGLVPSEGLGGAGNLSLPVFWL